MTDNPTLQSEKLEPCWCQSGGPLSVKANIDHGDFGCRERGRYVYCSNCWAHGPTYNTDAEAVTGWNSLRSRAPVVATQEDTAARIAQILNEDRCMWCGGKTEHKPDCDHGVRPSLSSPVPPPDLREVDERVNAAIQRMDKSQKVDAATMRIEFGSVREVAEEIRNYVDGLICAPPMRDFERDEIERIINKYFCSPVSAAGGDEDGWLPIATAPRDGTEIILAHGNSQWMDEWITDPKFEVRDGEGGCWMMCDQWEEPETPSHWKPLSPLPAAALRASVGEEGK